MRLLVVGGDAAGMTTASQFRRLRPDDDVAVIERGTRTSYSLCGIPYYIGGLLDDVEALVVRAPEEFEAAGIAVSTRTEALAIDAAARTVRVRDLDSGRERDEAYDHLLWAAGTEPIVPTVPGAEQFGHVVSTLDNAERLRRHLDEHPEIRRVAVVGAGYIGMEIAEALVRRGLQATLIERERQVMADALDPDMAAHVESALGEFGIELRLGEALAGAEGSQGRCRRVVTDAGAHDADALVLAIGARPSVDAPRSAGCRLGDSGALAVDTAMRTTVDGIWAAGDCVESTHAVSGRGVNVQLGTHANKQGKVAALNLAGTPAAFPGVVGTAVTKVCDWEIARTGLGAAGAHEAELAFAEVSFTGSATARYMPQHGRVHVKMLAEEATGRVLGAQLVGTGNVGKRIDTAATWCQLGVRVQDAQLLDLAYAPPFGGIWDLLQVGARKLVNELGLDPRL